MLTQESLGLMEIGIARWYVRKIKILINYDEKIKR